MRYNTSTAFLILLIILSGCTVEEKPYPKVSTEKNIDTVPSISSISTENISVYTCDESLRFTAHVTKDSTWLFLPDTMVKVTPVPTGSGARYEGNSYLYWTKGKEALLQLPKGALKSCERVPRK